MISSVTGQLVEAAADRIGLSVGPMTLEVLVPAADMATFGSSIGQEITLHTLMYLEGDSSGGNSEPRLLGFLTRTDKQFFEKFITVKGIGPKKALRALVSPTGEIAGAIEGKDARRLSQLPGIGKRTADQIIAELAGKVTAFVGADGAKTSALPHLTPQEDDAVFTLLSLGERRPEAEGLLARVKAADPGLNKTDELVRAMLGLRSGRR